MKILSITFIRFNTVAVVMILALFSVPVIHASDWNGTAGGAQSWNNNTVTGWNGTGVPNGVGAVASFGANGTVTITQDVSGGVTLGTITRGGTTNVGLLLGNGVVGNFPITLDQDGAGAGFATISNTNSNTGTTNRIVIDLGANNLTLADDLLISNTGGNITANGSIQFQSVIAGTGNITISNVANSVISPTSFPGAVRFQGVANTFTGSVLLQKGAVTYNNAASFGNAANVITLGQSGQGSVSLYATLAGLNVPNNIVVAAGTGGTTVFGSNSASAGNSTYSGTVALNGDATVTSSQTGTGAVRLQGVISGSGNLTKSGTGRVTLTANNTYTGATTINDGILKADVASVANVSGAYGLNSAVSLANTAGATADITGFNTQIGSLAGGGTTGGNVVLGAATLTTGGNNTNTNYAGVISGTGGVTKIGTGTQTLAGTNTYTGATAVNGGTLLVNGSLAAGSVVTVSSGATLGGSGTINGNTTISSGGTLAPGNSPGVLTFNGTLSLAGTTAVEINGLTRDTLYDGINTGVGLLTLGGDLNLNFGAGTSDLAVYDLFNIGGGGLTGSFATVNLGGLYTGSLTNSSGTWTGTNGGFNFTFVESTGDLNITAVPEPSTYALIGLGLGALALLRRKQKKAA